ncbi:MAG: polysaccharide deacetylase family protein, partial [Candidatus Hydrogenedentes bacterium]|nr:polysaccharide deacetylase family protein [Candidatus Hydrogenedentota bacterium]
ADLREKTVVLTLAAAVKSQITVVAPALKERGFDATFFISQLWMDDPEHFLSWEDVGTLHEMGFEIGNHTWTHIGVGGPRSALLLEGELALVEHALKGVGVPKPISFAWPGNSFCIEGVAVLEKAGYKLARRGMQPELPYGKIHLGPRYEPERHHPLLIPTTGDAYPDWTLDHFKTLVHSGKPGQPVILQFHGVPDITHPWVHTPPERFIEYMDYLKAEGFNVIAMRDLLPLVEANPEAKSMPAAHYPLPKGGILGFPPEVNATRADLRFWLENMLVDHGYSLEEAAQVTGWDLETVTQVAKAVLSDLPERDLTASSTLKILPYPGGRHPRIGFLDGAIAPHRGTKASIFSPWPDGGYVVLDVPEAIWQEHELIYLDHTDIPTYWDKQNVRIENIDWTREETGLHFERTLPNNVAFGVALTPGENDVDIDLWLKNGTEETLTGLRAQVCVMLKEMPGFAAQSNDNKTFDAPVTVIHNEAMSRWILVAFQNIDRCWGNQKCPCAHADPKLPDTASGERSSVKGRIWFYEGADVETQRAQAKAWAAL